MLYFLFQNKAEIKDRSSLDVAQLWTMIYNQPSDISGQITNVNVFASATGRRLKLGVYRPVGTSVCTFQLLQEFVADSVDVGRYTVSQTQ